jgi:site-specific DNA-methyltransferase (adenine-specific)
MGGDKNMITITEKLYNKMPEDIKVCFNKLPNHGSQEVLELFPDSNGSGKSRTLKRSSKPEQQGWGMNKHKPDEVELPDAGSGSAARFFYCAKASKRERNAGLEGMEKKQKWASVEKRESNSFDIFQNDKPQVKQENFHPTVKPVKLMEYLVRLVTPKDGVCLDPFMGSGTTGVAAKNLNRNFIGIEIDESYFALASKRIRS